MYTILITACLAVNCFLAGAMWETENTSALPARIGWTLLYLLCGTLIWIAFYTLGALIYIGTKVDKHTHFYFWTRWVFKQSSFKGLSDRVLDRMALDYKTKPTSMTRLQRYTFTKAIEKILLLNNRQLP